MKRYKMETYSIDFGGGEVSEVEPVEDPQGEWVKHKNVKKLLNRLGHDVSVAGFHERIERPESVKCNCVKNAAHPSGVGLAKFVDMRAWICPAHGYKRL